MGSLERTGVGKLLEIHIRVRSTALLMASARNNDVILLPVNARRGLVLKAACKELHMRVFQYSKLASSGRASLLFVG